MAAKRIGCVSTRFAGTDGVSLEVNKWVDVLRDDLNCDVYWFAGILDRDPEVSMLVEEAFFGHEKNQWIDQRVFGSHQRAKEVTAAIDEQAAHLKAKLYDFVAKFNIDLLLVENALCIPMHIPLGKAITEFIAETNIPSISHHHDFFWERDRFKRNAIGDYLQSSFPPILPSMQHVTINSMAQLSLAARRGCHSIMVPNVHDFETPTPKVDDYLVDMREQLGFKSSDTIFLQPTRVIPRKGIEHAINLMAQLKIKDSYLVISHNTGDEGDSYCNALVEYAHYRDVDIRFIEDRIDEFRCTNDKGQKMYSLGDAYHIADMVTYPSTYEGFGNAFLETIYFKKPIVVNRYTTYIEDIEPKGFEVAALDGFVTPEVVAKTRQYLDDAQLVQRDVEKNFDLGVKHFSYRVLRTKLTYLLENADLM
ncbi:MAG: glycosyltransferase family 4 protein [Planctomycetes bacterium]|nr:glycosyltransferase family 4 protein [Planctomycetota bacterium]